MAHSFHPSAREAKVGGFLAFEANLVYIVSSRTTGTT